MGAANRDGAPTCGHHRHWNDGVVDDGTGDWETCDECGKAVCFDLDCPNGWTWGDDGAVLCRADSKEPLA